MKELHASEAFSCAELVLKMWPFKRKPKVKLLDPSTIQSISYTQIDITEYFGAPAGITSEQWVRTIPLNKDLPHPTDRGLPATDATDELIYQIAERMSRVRDAFQVESDGVYCPCCHIANIAIDKLNDPCPKCSRKLLRFGWD